MLIKLGIGKEQNRKSYQVPLWGGGSPPGLLTTDKGYLSGDRRLISRGLYGWGRM